MTKKELEESNNILLAKIRELEEVTDILWKYIHDRDIEEIRKKIDKII